MIWIAASVVVLTLSAAIAVMVLRNLLAAVAAASVVSLGVAIVFVMMRAPDVAMTEAAVGAGLSGLILVLALRRLGLVSLQMPTLSESSNPATPDPESHDA
ncbi:hydrogenase subunit MbhD domain-containing protein [Thiosocius teredinicola]|uniref:hydrogenase subunit MbhD domain-containing protein n=1 Tax=Thiosocius teredinicola TaxID=1973002 RepID=UPI000990C207